MAYEFGTLKERLVNAQFRFILDGTDISEDETPSLVSKLIKPAADVFTEDFSLGRINNAKYVPKTKDRVREWGLPTGGYKERTTKTVTEDAYEITVIDYATSLFDQLAFGLANPTAATVSQQAFASANRYKDGWGQLELVEEDRTKSGILTIHLRIEIATAPEMKNEDGSPVWRITHLADAGVLDTYVPYPAA